MEGDNTDALLDESSNPNVCDSKTDAKESDPNTCQTSTVSDDSTGHMSKRQLRRLRKHEKWLEHLPEKRAKEKQKKKQRRQEALARGESLGPSRKMLKMNSMENSACKVRVVLDCSFDEYMNERDVMKLSKQVGFSYCANRRAKNPIQFYVTGLHGQMKDRFESVGDYKSWDVNFTEENYYEVFDKDKIVYLSADSPNVLSTLSDDLVYVIGGLVDHNQYKGLCHEIAVGRGLNHAQLPIGQYIEMKSRRILTVNHVFEILLKYTETKDWKTAFYSIIPQRKVAGGKDIEDESHQLPSCASTDNNSEKESSATSDSQEHEVDHVAQNPSLDSLVSNVENDETDKKSNSDNSQNCAHEELNREVGQCSIDKPNDCNISELGNS